MTNKNDIIQLLKNRIKANTLFLPFYLLVFLLLVSCAKMGQPDGGWFDETPPKVIGASPADGAVNVNQKKINIYFDEFIKLDNPSEKVVVSPPQLEQPEIKGAGRRIQISLVDSLKANTTYTIDFSDAIHADSAFRTKPMLRVSRTDSRGRFVIKGVAPGSYRIYALQDQDGDYKFSQKSEKIAFSHDIIVPSCKPDVRQDTTWVDSLHIKSIDQVDYIHFLPDNIVLRAFTEPLTDRFFLKAERQKANSFTLYLLAEGYGTGESGYAADGYHLPHDG